MNVALPVDIGLFAANHLNPASHLSACPTERDLSGLASFDGDGEPVAERCFAVVAVFPNAILDINPPLARGHFFKNEIARFVGIGLEIKRQRR